MAYEVTRMKYMWYSDDPPAFAKPEEYNHKSDSFRKIAYVFRANPIHDFESLWWILVWTLTRNSPLGVQRTRAHERYHHELFVRRVDRNDLLSSAIPLSELVDALPREFADVCMGMLALKRHHVNAYRIAEKSNEDFDCAPLHESFFPSGFV